MTGDILLRPPGKPQDAPPLEVSLGPGDRLVLVPSHFIWPEFIVVARCDRDSGVERRTVLVVHAVDGLGRREAVPCERLLRLLRGVGDATRLQILRVLARGQRPTRELAARIGLTEAAISKHLKVLSEAGWVSAERRGYYVYYRLARESLGDLSRGLEEVLG